LICAADLHVSRISGVQGVVEGEREREGGREMGVNSCAGTAAVSSWNQRLLLPPLQRLHNSENHTISSRHYSLLPEFQGLRAVAATTATGVGGGGGGISSVSDITTLLKTPALSNLSGVAGTIFFLSPSSHLRFFPSGCRVFPCGCSTTNNLSTNRECFLYSVPKLVLRS